MARRRLGFVGQRLINAAMLGACALLAVWGIAHAQRRAQQRARLAAQSQSAQKHLFDLVRTADVTHIALETPTNGAFELVRQSPGAPEWRLVAPIDTLAEASGVEAMLQSAATLEATQTVLAAAELAAPNAGAERLGHFGLLPPLFRLSLTCGGATGEAATTQTLAIGKRSHFDGSVFVQRGAAQAVVLVPGAFLASVDRDLYQLRDKRIMLLEPARLTRLRLEASSFNPGYTLERQTDGFALTKPWPARADRQKIDSLVAVLAQLRGKRVVAEAAAKTALSAFGLQRPRFVVTIWLDSDAAEGAPSLQLQLGEIQLRGVTHTFARTGDGQGPVWELDTDYVCQLLRQEPQTLQDMRVLHIEPEHIAEVTVHRSAQTQSFVRRRNPAGAWQPWQLAGNANQPIHSSHVSALVARVVDLQADAIVATELSGPLLQQSGLDRAQLEVDLLDAGGHLLGSLLLGAQQPNGVLVTTDSKKRIDRIDGRAFDDIAAAPAHYLAGPDDPAPHHSRP